MTVQDLIDYAIKPFYSDYIKAVLQNFAETIIQDDSLSDIDRYELMDWKVKQLENGDCEFCDSQDKCNFFICRAN